VGPLKHSVKMAAQSFYRSCNRSNLDSVSVGEDAKVQEPPKESRRVISDPDRATVHALQTAETKSCDGDAQAKKGLKPLTGQNTKSCTGGNQLDGLHDRQLSGCVKTDATGNDCVHATHEVEANLPARRESGSSGKGEEKMEDRKTEEPKPGSTSDPEGMKVRLQILLHILETSQDAEEKKATLQQISRLAEAMKDIIRIELEEDDGDSSDCHSTVSSSEPLLDIPLPDQPFSRSKTSSDADLTGIPLPGSSPVKRIQSTLFFDEDSSEVPPLPPLPLESSGKKEAKSSGVGKGKQRDGSGNESKRSSKTDGAERCLEFLRDDMEDGALQTNTSLGLITLHVNKKLVPRLSRASVFDLNDENAKEIGRKLLRLKKLKKLRKMEEVAEHKIEAKERISMWKEELLGNGGLSLPSNPIAASLAGNLPQPEKKSEEPRSERVDTVTQNPTTDGLALPTKLETPAGDGIQKSGTNESLNKDPKKPNNQKPLTFVKVQSKDEKKEYNWPVEMILSTKLSPKICYSCNPLEFDFSLSNVTKDLGKAVEEAKNKDLKKKKSRGGSSHKRNSHSSLSIETQRKEDGQKTGSGSAPRSEGGGSGPRDACKKPATETGSSNPSHVVQPKGRDESKNGQKRKSSSQSNDLKKTSKTELASKVNDAASTQKGKGPGPDSKDAKKTPSSTKEQTKGSGASEERNRKDQKIDTDTQKMRDITLQKNSVKDSGRKRKLSAGDSKQPTKKKMNVQQASKSVELAQIGSGKVSDFEDVDVGTGAGKWDTSSDSEHDLPGPSKPPTIRTSAKVEVSRRNDKRQRRSHSSSERDSSSSRERHSNHSDDDSQRSRSRSRSYSSRSYYSSDRSCSYSSDSDYHRGHSRSSTRSRSRRRSSSYSDRSYRSKSRSYARSRRSRSRSGSRDRFRSYSTYSRSSRSYSRSRSRSKSRSYRRYSRSFDKRSYDRRSGRAEVQTRTTKQERKQETKSKGESHNTKSRKNDEHLSSSTKQSSLSKSGQSKEISNVDVLAKASSAVSETTGLKTNEENEKVENGDKSGKVDETLQSDVDRKPESNGKDTTLSIPLPSSSNTQKSEENGEQSGESALMALSFIGPTLPNNHPLAHVQDIPVPKNAQFQPIGPNDPLVFKTPLLPPPPPPSFLTEPGSKVVGHEPPLPPKPRSPPPLPNDWSTMEDIIGDEEPIPHMLDMGAMKPAMIIPPEQADQYRALQQQAQQHARQRMRQEAGIDDEEEEEPPPDEAQLQQQQQQQLIDEMMLEQAQNATFLAAASAQPMIHIPQQQLLAPGIGSAGHQVVVGSSGFFQMPMTMQMVSTGHPHGLMTLAPSMVPVHPQTGTPMVIAAQQSGAMSALIRAHEAQAQAQAHAQAQAEAAEEAEAQAKAQASILQAQPHQEWVQIVQMPGGRTFAIPAGQSIQHGIHVSGLRSTPHAALHQVHPHGMIPVHAVNHPSFHHPQQTLVQSIPYGLQMRVGLTPSVINAPQVLASAAPQPQGMPFLIDSSGNILVPRLLRQGHL